MTPKLTGFDRSSREKPDPLPDCCLAPENRQTPIRFSVIIPTRDRPEDLAAAVRALLGQTLQPAEIIVVDQGAGDESERALAEAATTQNSTIPAIRYERDADIDGLTAARNRGITLARESWLLYIDDDAVPEPQTLALLSEAILSAPHLVAVSGIITNYRRPPRLGEAFNRLFSIGPLHDERQPIYWGWSEYPAGSLVRTSKINGGLTAIRRDALLAIGGFDSRYRGSCVGEDIEVSQRLAAHFGPGVLAFVGGAYLEHASRGTWKRVGPRLGVELMAAHYILSRATQRRTLHWISFAWLVTGRAILCVVRALRSRDLNRLRELVDALRCISDDYAGCSFLRGKQRTES